MRLQPIPDTNSHPSTSSDETHNIDTILGAITRKDIAADNNVALQAQNDAASVPNNDIEVSGVQHHINEPVNRGQTHCMRKEMAELTDNMQPHLNSTPLQCLTPNQIYCPTPSELVTTPFKNNDLTFATPQLPEYAGLMQSRREYAELFNSQLSSHKLSGEVRNAELSNHSLHPHDLDIKMSLTLVRILQQSRLEPTLRNCAMTISIYYR